MAQSNSARKRVRQGAKRRMRNRQRKSAVKTQVKKCLEAFSGKDLEAAEREFRAAVKKLDRVASTSTLHKNTAARTKSRLAKRLSAFKAKLAS